MPLDLFAKLERTLEGLFEGLFSKGFRGRIQPLEVARRISRCMEEHKLISVTQVFAPNEFEILLHPEDYNAIVPFEAAILPELVQHIEETAADARYGLVGAPQVCFKADEAISRGDLRIQGHFVRKEAQVARTPQSPTTALNAKPAAVVHSTHRAALLVTEGPEAGEEFVLSHAVTTIGRGGTNHVALLDGSVSRSHAEIALHPDGFYISDVGSKNGTFVNGMAAEDTLLCDGDTICIGVNVFQFKDARVL